MFTYPRALTVKPGDPILAEQWNSLAEAWKARMLTGPNVGWRMMYLAFSANRQPRNPDAEGNFPAQGEFFTAYQMISPGTGTWPDAGPGEAEGANTQSQMMAYLFGVDAIHFPNESDRLTNPAAGGVELEVPGGYVNATPLSWWQLAKLQRGAYDAASGDFTSPALESAASASSIRYTALSPHGLAWGDFLAGPTYLGVCSGVPSSYSNYQLTFTELVPPYTVLNYGTCNDPGGDLSMNLAGVAYTPWAYVLFFFDGHVVNLPTATWIEGPYTSNPAPTKTQNEWLRRVYQKFVGDWRGGASGAGQLPPAGGTPDSLEGLLLSPESEAPFDFQTFITSQYLLAPQRGVSTGTTIMDRYRRLALPPATAPGVYEGALPGSYDVTGYVCASAFLYARNLTGPATVAVFQTLKGLQTQILTLEAVQQADGSWQAYGTVPSPVAGGSISAALVGTAVFNGAAQLWVEFTELMPYTPSVSDAMLILRLGGMLAGSGVLLDGSGVNNDQAADIYANYVARGCCTSASGLIALPGSDDAANTNAIFEANRRLSMVTRWVPRQNVLGYAVIGGNSVVWFNRYAYGIDASFKADLFGGIGPSPYSVASGQLQVGRVYVVQGTAGQVVRHAEVNYPPGAQFTAVDTDWTGAATPYEYEGIIETASPGGVTNEWQMGVELFPLNPNNASIWKPDAFADQIGPFNRCLFCDYGVGSSKAVLDHVAFGQQASLLVYQPEAPDAWNYVPTPDSIAHVGRANEGASADQYSSCRVYEPWPEIQSVVVDPSVGPNVVKVTFKGRLHHHPSAPSSIANNPGAWDFTGQTYRTWENGIQQGILYQQTSAIPAVLTGDQSSNQGSGGGCPGLLDAPGPCILPRFYFVRFPRRPAAGSGTVSPTNTPTWFDEFLYLDMLTRAGCEGFVDGTTSAALFCTNNAADVYNYTFENLVRQATGGKWFSPVAWSTTEYLEASQIAPSRPEYAGPLPWCIMAAQVFNQYSLAVNLLDTIPLRIPADLQYTQATSNGTGALASVLNAMGQPVPPNSSSLGGLGNFAVYAANVWTIPPPGTPSGWNTWGGENLSSNAEAQINSGGGGWDWTSILYNYTVYRWEPQTDVINALPPVWQDMLETNASLFGQWVINKSSYAPTIVAGSGSGTFCSPPAAPPDVTWDRGTVPQTAILWAQTNDSPPATCGKVVGGILTAPPLLPSYSFTCYDPVAGSPISVGPTSGITLSIMQSITPVITVQLSDPITGVASFASGVIAPS